MDISTSMISIVSMIAGISIFIMLNRLSVVAARIPAKVRAPRSMFIPR